MTSTELAVRTAVSEMAITDEQTRFNEMQVAGLEQLGIANAPQAVLDLFFHRCRVTRLDPFSKQIYLIARKVRVNDYAEKTPEYETKYTTQTGIDGFRLNGKRAAKRENVRLAYEGPFWHDGNRWSDVWLGGPKTPVAAKYTIIVDGEPHTGIAMYAEFVQTTGYGDRTKPNSMWSKMPANQTAKCAEAQAWRKAFPDDFSDLHLEDAAQIIDPDGAPVSPTRVPSERVSAAGIIEARRPAAAEAPAAKKAPAKRAAKHAEPGKVTAEQLERAVALFERAGITEKIDQRAFVDALFSRTVGDPRTLTEADGEYLLEQLSELPPAEGERVDNGTEAGQ